MAGWKHNPKPSMGDGWGGPAKGASTTKGRVAEFQPMSNDPEIKARRAAQAEQLHEHLYELATQADRQETQLAATVAFLDRVEGKPVARSDTRISGGEGGPVNFTWLPPTE